MHALVDEKLLAEHSLHARLRCVHGENVLVRRTMPGCEELGALLCDEMRIRFEELSISTRLVGEVGVQHSLAILV